MQKKPINNLKRIHSNQNLVDFFYKKNITKRRLNTRKIFVNNIYVGKFQMHRMDQFNESVH